MTEDEEFFAWLDGELDAEQASRVEARVAASPELAARAAEHQRLTARLQRAFFPVLDAGIPSPTYSPGEVVDFGARAVERDVRRPQFGVPQWAAMAATLALGLLVGNLANRGAYSPVAIEDGHLVAAAALEQALDSQLASAPSASGTRIELTFRNTKGHVCRSFSDPSASGLACRENNEWRVQGLFQGADQSGDYRMAAGQDPRLAALIDQVIAGEPFDANQERAAKNSGWR